MASIAIGVPYLDIFYPEFVNGFLALDKGPSFNMVTYRGCYLDESRNIIVKFFLDETNAEYLLFLDSDVIPTPDALKALIEADKDMIGGLYFSKESPYLPVIYREENGNYVNMVGYEKNAIIEVDAIGCGFLLIKRSVFEKLKNRVDFLKQKNYHAFFSFKDGIGEDLFFSKIAKKAGFKIFCHTGVVCKHLVLGDITERHFEIMKPHLKKKE